MVDLKNAKEIVAWMQARNANPACPNCGGQDWKQGGSYRLNRMPGFGVSDAVRGASVNTVTPRIYFVCVNCSHVSVFTNVTQEPSGD
jgi:hypothetical protein